VAALILNQIRGPSLYYSVNKPTQNAPKCTILKGKGKGKAWILDIALLTGG